MHLFKFVHVGAPALEKGMLNRTAWATKPKALTCSCLYNESLATSNGVTYVRPREVCGSVGVVQQGKQVHVEIRETGCESNVLVEVYCVVMPRLALAAYVRLAQHPQKPNE